jgi:predicted benzoate:H+ symporter BenE
MAERSATAPTRRFLLECSGACGDLGTFIPHVIGAMTVAGLAPVGVLLGFAVFLIATGLFYGLPLPVQPMKAISAVILTGGLRPGEVVGAGIIMGVVLVVLGTTGWIGRLARVIPQSVSTGLQLGLGLLMGVLGLKLILETPWLGFGSLALLFALTRVPRCPAAPLALGVAMLAGWATGSRRSRSHQARRTLWCRAGRRFGGAFRSRFCRSSRLP